METIPDWNIRGVLPHESGGNYSPYRVTVLDAIRCFATSPERIRLMNGFLAYRARLREAGIIAGFQWLNGSFLEHTELLERQPPNDLDVVTFFRISAEIPEAEVIEKLGDMFPVTSQERESMKAAIGVDPYLVDLALPTEELIQLVVYWAGLWGHRRDDSRKGFLQVDLASHDDFSGMAILKNLASEHE